MLTMGYLIFLSLPLVELKSQLYPPQNHKVEIFASFVLVQDLMMTTILYPIEELLRMTSLDLLMDKIYGVKKLWVRLLRPNKKKC